MEFGIYSFDLWNESENRWLIDRDIERRDFLVNAIFNMHYCDELNIGTG
jgi:hypothetical protein